LALAGPHTRSQRLDSLRSLAAAAGAHRQHPVRDVVGGLGDAAARVGDLPHPAGAVVWIADRAADVVLRLRDAVSSIVCFNNYLDALFCAIGLKTAA
jgi:hypothetical protein